MSQRLDAGVEGAIQAFADGEPVLVYDFASREGEVDLIYPAAAVEPADVARLRNDAGGLICVAVGAASADVLELPYFADVVDHPAAGGPVAYDDRSSFSLTVNHRDTYTGVTDRDRALTIRSLATAAASAREDEYTVADFAGEFRVPGHVHLLRAADSLDERQGHTELAVVLADAAGVEPAAVVCEMLDDATGEALSARAARAYARRHELVFVDGSAIVEHFG